MKIYLNNAATSWPKPPSVIEAVTAALTCEPVSALRSNRSACDDLMTELRQKLGRLFHISDCERIFFCSSATDAINRIVDGLGMANSQQQSNFDYAIDSHNSVLRPLANKGKYLWDGRLVHYDALFLNHCSNVTGEICDIGREWHNYQVVHRKTGNRQLLILDAAQSAGCIPIDVDGWGVDILVFTGHKGLFGPMGTGGYYVRRGIDLRPSQFGGTGRDSSIIEYGDGDEWEYEVGTQNLPGLAGLMAGVDYVLERGVENIRTKEQQLTQWLINELRDIDKVQLYVAPTADVQGPVVSFNIQGLNPSDVGYILQNSYGITVRTGLHCSPLIHHRLGTEKFGTVRASLSDFTTQQDLQTLVQAVNEISASLVRFANE